MNDSSKKHSSIQNPPDGVGTPDQVAVLIGYALSQLSVQNAHHEFEHLCRHITRRRIASNIIPSTGPVSAGGDAGADFETISVSEPPHRKAIGGLSRTRKLYLRAHLSET